MYDNGNATLINVTFLNNSGGGSGIYSQNNLTTVRNTILVQNGGGDNCGGDAFASGSSSNWANDASCGTGTTQSSNIRLGGPGNYGGGTLTVPLLAGSAGIDAGDAAYCPPTDQRGAERIGPCDAGAFEYGSVVFTTRLYLPLVTTGTGAVADQTCNASIASSGGLVAVISATWKAQTFVPGVNGELVRVTLSGVHHGGTTTLHVRAVDAQGAPGGSDLGSASITSGNVFGFTPGISLQVGVKYALVLSNVGGYYEWEYSSSSTCYGSGAPFTSVDGGASWGVDQVDFYFTTYVTPSLQSVTMETAPTP